MTNWNIRAFSYWVLLWVLGYSFGGMFGVGIASLIILTIQMVT